MEALIYGIACVAGFWVVLSSAIESGVKHGIKSALNNATIKINTYDHR